MSITLLKPVSLKQGFTSQEAIHPYWNVQPILYCQIFFSLFFFTFVAHFPKGRTSHIWALNGVSLDSPKSDSGNSQQTSTWLLILHANKNSQSWKARKNAAQFQRHNHQVLETRHQDTLSHCHHYLLDKNDWWATYFCPCLINPREKKKS